MAERAVNLYTIPSSQPFLKKLAEGLLQQCDGDQNLLSRMRILLPTRRASRGLRDAFLEIFDHKAVLLPRLQPLSDIDESELDLTLSGLGLDISDVLPAIRPLERQFLLAQLVKIKSPGITTEQSLVLANKLSSLMDQVHTEGLDFSALKNLVDDSTLSTHWQETIEFLDIVTTNWPQILKERGQIDPSERRARLMKTLTDLWSHTPPAHPVIAAGSTGSIPTTANLLETIARMTNGSVILPGLDLEMDDKSWNRIDDTHPQRTMKNLLDRIGITRKDVALWPTCQTDQINTPRQKLCRDIMRPAETFGRAIPDQAMIEDLKTHITICETENPREHASTIATAIRIALEPPNQTVCFVTPDRPLARRVTTALKRWGIEADDSAGQSLATTQSGILILTFIRLLEEQFSPIPFLELLKHPLSAYRHISATELAAFELLILRGPKPAAGWDGLRARFNNLKDYEQKTCAALFEKLDREFSPFEPLVKTTAAPNTIIETLIAGFEQICGQSGIAWGQEESQTLSSFLSELLENAATLPPMTFGECANMLRTLLSQETFRKTESRHPRLVILGQLEARLIRHDVMILSGLNEGLWPSEPGHDPFMSRPMRQKFGLPPAGRSIGLSAHDFTEALQANQVILTRAIKENGTETVPARWLQRLKTLLHAAHHEPDWTNTHLIEWTRQLDRHQENLYTNTEAPEPRPPRSYRPQELSATWIEKWMKNPYHVYAAKILNLKPAPKIEENLIHADKGTLIHDTLEEFIKKTSDYFPAHEDAKTLFLDLANQKLQQLESLSPQWHYWAPRLPHIAEWVVTQESEWRKIATPWMLEQTGRYRIYQNDQTGREFTITAKADRIDRIKGGSSAAIIDYKTGTPPSQTKIMTGHAPQLAIEALILSKGGYPTSPLETSLLAYWKIDQSGKVTDLTTARDITFGQLVPDAEEGITGLVTQFEDPLTPYTALPLIGRLYDDEKAYAHLARMAEWAIAGNSDDEAGSGEAA